MADDGSILPFILIWMLVSLFWLFAMVPFSAVVLFPEQKPDPNARDVAALRHELLALNDQNEPFRLVPGESEGDLHLEWDVVDSSWYELYAKVKLTVTYRAFNARDIDAALALMHTDVDWPNGMEGGRVHGHQAVRDYWTRQWGLIDPHVEPIDFRTDEDGRTVVDVHQVVRDLAGMSF